VLLLLLLLLLPPLTEFCSGLMSKTSVFANLRRASRAITKSNDCFTSSENS